MEREVDPATGITVGRFASTRNTVTPAVSYQLTPLTHLRFHYSFAALRSTTGTFRYTFSRFEVEGTPARDAHLPRVGLAYALSPTIRIVRWLSISGGYRYLRQDDRTGPLNLERNLVFVGLTASADTRVY